MKKQFLTITALIVLLASCPLDGGSSPGNNPVKPVDPNNPVEPEKKTLVVFDNTYGVCDALVFDSHLRRSQDKKAEVPAGQRSAEIEWYESERETFYFAYVIKLNNISNFTLTYVPENGKDQTSPRIEANKTTNILIPKLDDTFSSSGQLLSSRSYLLLQNKSSNSFTLQRGDSPVTPDMANLPAVNSMKDAFYTINTTPSFYDPGSYDPGAGTAANYKLLAGTDNIQFPASPVTFEPGHFYSYTYNGVSFVFDTEIPVNIDNVLIQPYTIRFDINGGSGPRPPALDTKAGITKKLPDGNGLTKTNFTFGGWNPSASGDEINYSAGADYLATGDITLYAKWHPFGTVTYTVTFESNGGTTASDQYMASGLKVFQPIDPIRNGYFFVGWYSDAGFNTAYDFAKPVTNDITLYAKWEGIREHTVIFNVNGGIGAVPASRTANTGTVITLPDGAGLSREGYDFDGWSTDASGGGNVYNEGASYTVISDITLFARWRQVFSLNLDRAERVSLTNNWYAVYRFVLPPGKTWADYKGLSADYLFTAENLATARSRNGRLMGPYKLSDLTLCRYMSYLAVIDYSNGKNDEYILDKGKLALDSAAGALVKELSSKAGINAEANKWFTYNYVIDGSAKGGSYAVDLGALRSDTGPFYFGIGLCAGLENDPPNIHYIRDVKLIGYNAADTVTATPLWVEWEGNLFPAFTGYPSFDGLYGYREAYRVMADGSQPAPVQAVYTVTFNSNGGSPVPAQTVNFNGWADPPARPVKSGSAFQNWYSDPGLTNVYDFSTRVTGDITLYAKWNDSVTVTSPSGIVMVYVPGGSFEMGLGHNVYYNEEPVHTVTLSGFYMGKYEVTQAQYQAVTGRNPSEFIGSYQTPGETAENRPVENVSWYDAIIFCNKLSMAEGLSPAYSIGNSTDPSAWGTPPGYQEDVWNAVVIVAGSNGYRLPTEAQWEYAAKGGDGSPGNYNYSGSDLANDVSWCYFNSDSMTHEVGKKEPNGLGIYDMSGNVEEWCWDWYERNYTGGAQTNPLGPASGYERVFRGGSYNTTPGVPTVRYGTSPGGHGSIHGIRLARPQ